MVKSSNDCKLALHIGCAPNAKEYSRCCLPVISLLRIALAHACIQSLTRKPHFRQPGLNSLQPTSECGLALMWVGFNPGSTRIHQKRVQCGHAQPELNLSSTRVQVAVRTCIRVYLLVTRLPWSRHFCKQNTQQSCRTCEISIV